MPPLPPYIHFRIFAIGVFPYKKTEESEHTGVSSPFLAPIMSGV